MKLYQVILSFNDGNSEWDVVQGVSDSEDKDKVALSEVEQARVAPKEIEAWSEMRPINLNELSISIPRVK